MNARRFVARTSRDALAAVRQAFGDDAVVLSTKPCAEGVEVLAMAPDGLAQIEAMAVSAPRAMAAPALRTPAAEAPRAPALPRAAQHRAADAAAARASAPRRPAERPPAGPGVDGIEEDVGTLSMSTLSFQDYVRERMLKRRQEAMREEAASRPLQSAAAHATAHSTTHATTHATGYATSPSPSFADMPSAAAPTAPAAAPASHAAVDRGLLEQRMAAPQAPVRAAAPVLRDAPLLHDSLPAAEPAGAAHTQAQAHRDQEAMLAELRQVKGLIEERFGALAFMEKLQREPGHALLTQKLLDCGFSPALTRKLADSLPADAGDPAVWAAGVLERNLVTAEADAALEDQGGVYALIGATGVGKTTTTAKIAAAFAARHGAAHLGLITLDAYRVGAQEQLRTYGRILGVPVHTAHDRASLEDLLDLLSAKRMVLIDTAGMAQRDTRTKELLEMVSHRSIRKLLVVNAASQGETIEDVLISYRAATAAGVVLSKLDEAVKLAPALDTLIRHKLKVVGVANGQRVPEDWHRLSASALVQRALRGGGSTAYRLDPAEVNLVFAAAHGARSAGRPSLHA